MQLPYSHLKYLNPTDEEAAACERIVNGTTGWVARHINKRFSLPISLILARRGFRPNRITFFNMIVGLFSGIFSSIGTPAMIIWGALFFQLASILDGVDGEVAKINNSGSPFGQWLDTISDNTTLIVYLTGLAFGLYQQDHNPLIIVLVEIALASIVILIGIMVVFLKRNTDSGSFVTYDKEFVQRITTQESGFLPQFIKYGRYLLKKDSFAMTFLIFALIGFPVATLFFTALAATLGWVLMLYYKAKKIKIEGHL